MKVQSLIPLAFGLTTQACLLPSEKQAEHERVLYGRSVTSRDDTTPVNNTNTGYAVGTGDRFQDGTITPLGIGTKERHLDSLLSVNEVPSALKGLAAGFPDDTALFTPPYATFEGRTVHGLSVGENPRVFIQGGIHARERAGPDGIIYFAGDLLHAKEHGLGLTYGDKHYSHEDVLTALSAGMVIVPATNPDGIAYDERTNSCWRKNRNPTSAIDGVPESVGIDLNRNYDFLWDYTTAFNLSANYEYISSDDPASPIFHGTSPASEAEVKNSQWTMQNFDHLSWFVDVHSYSGVVLYLWGDDNYQTERPWENFANATYDGKRGFLERQFGPDPPGAMYKEYIEAEDLAMQNATVERMATAMTSGSGGTLPYETYEIASFYATSGGSTDYAMSMYYGHTCGAHRVNGLGVEFNMINEEAACIFYPTEDMYYSALRQLGAGFMELLLTAAGDKGERKVYKCCHGK